MVYNRDLCCVKKSYHPAPFANYAMLGGLLGQVIADSQLSANNAEPMSANTWSKP